MLFSNAFIVLSAVASVSVARMTNSRRHMNVAEVQRRSKPATYAEGYLEPYDTYHARYMAVGCKGQQGTTFFDDCCHPMLATETLENNRKAYCNPANKTASSTAAAATATTNGASTDDSDDCDSDGGDNNTNDADDDGDCDDDTNGGNDDDTPASTTAAPVTTSATPTPTTTTTKKAATTTSSKKAADPTTSATSGSGGSGDVKTGGFATFFYQNGVAGACGKVNQESSHVAAIDSAIYSGGSHCGKNIVITNTNNGKSITVQVADECPTCTNANSIDLSVGAFTSIATEAEGMVPIKWQWA